MELEQLLRQLHEYTKVEEYLMNHREVRNNKRLIQEFVATLNEEEAKEQLVPILPPMVSDTLNPPETFPESYFFNESEPLKVKITQHTRYSTPVMHKHDFYEMFYVYEGEFEQFIDNKTFVMRTGDICLVPPGVFHSLDVNNYSIVLNILIQKDSFQEIFFNNLSGDHIFSNVLISDVYAKKIDSFIIFPTNGDLKIKNMILDMFLETINKQKYYVQVVHSNLVLLFSHLLRHYEDRSIMPKPQRKRDVIDFEIITSIEKNYKDITLEQLSDSIHYSTQHISLRIKQLTGESFTKFVLRKRMTVAADLLKHTNMKIQDIGPDVGYKNQENFIRSFRKFYETTPSQFRKNHSKFKL